MEDDIINDEEFLQEIRNSMDALQRNGVISEYSMDKEKVGIKLNPLGILEYHFGLPSYPMDKEILNNSGFFNLEDRESKSLCLVPLISIMLGEYEEESDEEISVKVSLEQAMEMMDLLALYNIETPYEYGDYYIFYPELNEAFKDIFFDNINKFLKQPLIPMLDGTDIEHDTDFEEILSAYDSAQIMCSVKSIGKKENQYITVEDIAECSEKTKEEIAEKLWFYFSKGLLRIA